MGFSEQNKHDSEINSPELLEDVTPPPLTDEALYIASVDLGTTTIRCFIYNTKAQFCCKAEEQIKLLYPKPGHVEIDPDELWDKFVKVIKTAITKAGITAASVSCLGLSTQRATFINWDRRNGEPLHNFITWKDIRADKLVKHWNSSWTMKMLRFGGTLAYKVCKNNRFQSASVLEFANIQVNMRLLWVLQNVEKVKILLPENNVMFGTIDTWLIYKLSQGKIHATDYSNASGTAIFDPYIMDWNYFFIDLFPMPRSLFPELRDSVGDWGKTPADLFGSPIQITAVVSDQGASLIGSCGLQRGDVKATLGTGAFINVNTGDKPHASVKGIYPVIGWKDSEGTVFMAEGSSNDNGTIIEWGRRVEFYSDPSETDAIARSCEGPSGIFFIPGFEGIQAPLNDMHAAGGFIGLSASTTKSHLVKAMLESLAFRVVQIYSTMLKEADYQLLNVRIDGGVSKNDFIMQLISTLLGKDLERPKSTDMSALGSAFLAGIGAGIWKSRSEIIPLREVDKTFQPQPELQLQLLQQMKEWERALQRFTKWHQE